MQLRDAEDVCECGDYRRDHPEDGPCIFNTDHSRGPNGGVNHGFQPCPRFRLVEKRRRLPVDPCSGS